MKEVKHRKHQKKVEDKKERKDILRIEKKVTNKNIIEKFKWREKRRPLRQGSLIHPI